MPKKTVRQGSERVNQTVDAMIDQLRSSGALRRPEFEAAFRAMPRQYFLPNLTPEEVYADVAVPIKRGADGQIISSSSQPTMMLYMLEQLDLQPGHNVLEIGTGSGYNAAIMQQIVGPDGKVTSVEYDEALAYQAIDNLRRAHSSEVLVVAGDGIFGYAPRAAYDRIICTANIWDIPPSWISQLKDDGLIVAPISVDGLQYSAAFQCVADNKLFSNSNLPCGFVRMQGIASPPSITKQVGSTAMHLYGEQTEQIDTVALHLLLSADQDQCYLSPILSVEELWRGFAPYLMLNYPSDAIFVIYEIQKDQQAYGIEGAGIALFSPGSACLMPYTEIGLTYCFAGADAFMMVDAVLNQWIEAGKPGSEALRLQLTPKAEDDTLPIIDHGRVYRRRDHDLHAWFETETKIK
jgi:protein-L-isoaspartate(D-aspartate) O-methyltransferase